MMLQAADSGTSLKSPQMMMPGCLLLPLLLLVMLPALAASAAAPVDVPALLLLMSLMVPSR